eukprot:13999390-Alexandrium_andersonii.AAC.1
MPAEVRAKRSCSIQGSWHACVEEGACVGMHARVHADGRCGHHKAKGKKKGSESVCASICVRPLSACAL